MPTLSVVMIVKDEAACLAACLASVADIADEIIIGDTGSFDASPAIAARFGTRVLEVPWEQDFAAARNQVLAEASGDWLLHLDADEVLDPVGAGRLRALVNRDGTDEAGRECDAIELTLANYCAAPRAWRWVPVADQNTYTRGYPGYIPVGLLRLFRNHRGFEYREAVHENITRSVQEQGGRVRPEDIVIHHYGYAMEGPRARQKARTYFEIARCKATKQPDDLKVLGDLAEQAFACGEGDAAEAACRHGLSLEPGDIALGTMLANLLLNRGDFAEARQVLDALVEPGATPPHVELALGALDLREGHFEAARDRLEALLAVSHNPVMVSLHLARAWDLLGDAHAALRVLEEAERRVPGIEEVADRILSLKERLAGETFLAEGDRAGAGKAFSKALKHDREDPLLHNDLGVLLHALGDGDRAASSFQRALKLAPTLQSAAENLGFLGERKE